MMRIAGIDIGNDSVKLVLNGQNDPIIIPNVISPGYERHILQEEESPLQALDVMVYSPKLKKKNQRYFVGLLASEDQDNAELEDTDNKATSDQALIVALTALAYAAAVNSSSQPQPTGGFVSADEAEYVIGTGLPVRTYAQFHRTFEERLVGEHEVTFLSTPKLRGRTIRLNIRRAIISVEGAAALFHMATHDNLQIRNEELYYGCIGVCEIGALTTDFPVVKRMSIDNQFSTGEQLGMAAYLDAIIRDVEDQFGYKFPSRAKLIQRIRREDYTVQLLGEGQADIKPIVDQYFSRAAQKIVDLIRKRWKKYPDIQCFYVLGGGAAALKPYLLEAAENIRLRFVDNSELQNVYGYLKLARNRMNQLEGGASNG